MLSCCTFVYISFDSAKSPLLITAGFNSRNYTVINGKLTLESEKSTAVLLINPRFGVELRLQCEEKTLNRNQRSVGE